MSTLPPDPPEEDQADPHCGVPGCGSLFHPTELHGSLNRRDEVDGRELADEWPPGYDPAEADRLIGREPRA